VGGTPTLLEAAGVFRRSLPRPMESGGAGVGIRKKPRAREAPERINPSRRAGKISIAEVTIPRAS